MSYRLIDSNALAMKCPEVNDMPCIFADLPNGLDCAYYSVDRFAEPKPGKWYDWSFTAFDGSTVWHRVCSVCGYKRDDDNLDKDTNYCPNCGAKMERSKDGRA